MSAARVARRVLRAVALACAVAPGVGGAQALPRPPRIAGATVRPETVTVGDPFTVTLRVRVPAGAAVVMPPAPDSGTGVEPLDPVAIDSAEDGGSRALTATYRLAAWDVGRRRVRLPDVLVRMGTRVASLRVDSTLSVEVSSVLPADTAQQVPRPPRALVEFGPPWWWWLLVAAAGLVVLWLVRRLWRRAPAPVAAATRTPLEEAELAFDRLDALQLVAAGEPGLHVALVLEVLRRFLTRVVPGASAAQTSAELLAIARAHPAVPVLRLQRLLALGDLVKFAARACTAEEAQQAGEEARGVARAVDAAAHAGTPPAEAA